MSVYVQLMVHVSVVHTTPHNCMLAATESLLVWNLFLLVGSAFGNQPTTIP